MEMLKAGQSYEAILPCLDETKTKHSALYGKQILYITLDTRHSGDSTMLWGCFFSAQSGNLVTVDGKMAGAKYRNITE